MPRTERTIFSISCRDEKTRNFRDVIVVIAASCTRAHVVYGRPGVWLVFYGLQPLWYSKRRLRRFADFAKRSAFRAICTRILNSRFDVRPFRPRVWRDFPNRFDERYFNRSGRHWLKMKYSYLSISDALSTTTTVNVFVLLCGKRVLQVIRQHHAPLTVFFVHRDNSAMPSDWECY